jgi:hypothetical protein
LANKAYAFQTSYTAKLDSKAIDDYKEYFESINVPNGSKMGVVYDIVHAYPFINGNGAGFTSDVLKNSYLSFLNSLIDINHNMEYIVGTIVKAEIIEDGNSPLTIRLFGVLDKDILLQWGIEDLISEDWSMECKFSQYCYSIGNKIYQPSDVPEIDTHFNEIAEGQPIYDKVGNRVNILLGGTNGTVDFNRCGLIIWGQGADSLAETHLQVANDKTKQNKKGSEINMAFKEFLTEADWNAAVASIKNDYKTELKFDQIQTDLQTAQASLVTKDTEITDLGGKLQTAEASAVSEKTRADVAEGKLTEIATAKLVEDRKTVLASKSYELDEEDTQFIASASQEDFDKFVKRIEKVQASTAKTMEAKAEKLGIKEAFASLNLTGKTTEDEGNGSDNKVEKPNILM